MTNANKPIGKTVFLDLDGTVVEHNYNPDAIPDTPLMRRIESLVTFLASQEQPCTLVITTGRSESHARQAVKLLREHNVYPDILLHSLPVGKRILINDSKDGSATAEAICVERNQDTPFLAL